MRSFFLASLASLAVFKSATAHPHPHNHGPYSITKRAVNLDSFRLKVASTYKNATDVESDPSMPVLSRRASTEETATELVQKTAPDATFRLVESYVAANGMEHFYFKQTVNDIAVDSADFNVNIGRDGTVFSFGNSFYEGKIPAPPSLSKRDSIEPVDALQAAVQALGLPVTADSATAEEKDEKDTFSLKQTTGTVSEPEARLVYVRDSEGELKLSWRVETDILSNWLLTYVDAESKEVHAVVDYSADATYQVYPWGINDPTEGERILVTDPFDSEASEFGWHSTQFEAYKTTRGNNAIAQTNWENKSGDYLSLPRPFNERLNFSYPYSLNETDYKSYANASVTQLFYTSNVYHDLLYHLGFTPAAGNFELNNNGEGGLGGDAAWLHAQDGSGNNNANFATPPDGQQPRMRMYIWNNTFPVRDCSFEAGVVIHEYTHGLSNRLTGGPRNSGCLSMLESGGMGEGWSDFYATAIRLKPQDTRSTDYPMGAWVNGQARGIRNFLYSTDMTVNPQTYESVNPLERVHPIGNIWASMLYEVLWNLIDKHGKNDNDLPEVDENGVPNDGKYLAMKLVLDGMALQPCNPTFVLARDAILDADKYLTNGANQCEIWSGFAKRGLGELAKFDRVTRKDSFQVPKGVCAQPIGGN